MWCRDCNKVDWSDLFEELALVQNTNEIMRDKSSETVAGYREFRNF